MTVLAYLTCAIVWGTTWFAVRVCLAPGAFETFSAVAIRMAIATLILGAIWAAGFAKPGPKGARAWGWIAGAGLLNAVGYGLLYLAQEELPGGLASVLYATAPFMMAPIAVLTRTEKIVPAQLGGAVLGMIGVIVISWDRMQVSSAQAVAVVLMLASTLMSSIYNVILKRQANDVNPLASSAIFLGVTTIPLAMIALARGEVVPVPPPPKVIAALLYLAIVGSVVAHVAYFYLIKRVTLMTLGTLPFIFPVIALATDLVLEKEIVIGPRTWIGVAFVFAGLFVRGPRH